MDFPSPPSPPPAPAPAYLRLKTTFAGKRQSPTAVSAAPFPATSSSKSTRIKTTLQTPTPHPHPHPNPNPHPQYSLDSDIPIHKQKGVNLLYNGPTSSFTRGGVEKWTRYTTTTSASMAAISHSSSKQQQEQQQQQLPPQTPIYNINNYSDSDSTHNWPAWKVQAWHDQCQDQQRELLDRRNIGNTRAESVEVTAFGSVSVCDDYFLCGS